MITNDPEQLGEQLIAEGADKHLLIGIDGTNGCGKTTLAMCLKEKLRATAISLDDFLEEGQGEYVPYIKFAELARALRRAREQGRHIIVEGICLLKVLEELGLPADVLVYVVRVKAFGNGNLYWQDEGELGFDGPEDALRNRIKSTYALAVRLLGEAPPPEDEESGYRLPMEVALYHHRYKPHKVAAHCFNVVDSDQG